MKIDKYTIQKDFDKVIQVPITRISHVWHSVPSRENKDTNLMTK